MMKAIAEGIGLYGNPASPDRWILPMGSHESGIGEAVVKLLEDLRPGLGRALCLVTLPVADWNRDLSPWEAPPVFGNEAFGGKADATLRSILDDLLPHLDASCPTCAYESGSTARYFLCGYSLAGLFALWVSSVTTTFPGIVAASPSVWFPGWDDFATAHPTRADTVYLSLGDREERVRNPVLAHVGDSIRQQYDRLRGAGVPCTLEWNPGNHFADPALRLAKGIVWLSDVLRVQNADRTVKDEEEST